MRCFVFGMTIKDGTLFEKIAQIAEEMNCEIMFGPSGLLVRSKWGGHPRVISYQDIEMARVPENIVLYHAEQVS